MSPTAPAEDSGIRANTSRWTRVGQNSICSEPKTYFKHFWTFLEQNSARFRVFPTFHDTTSCARSAHIQIQCCQKMTACNKKIFPCKGTFSAITLERLIAGWSDRDKIFRDFAATCIHALSTDVALDIYLFIYYNISRLGGNTGQC